MATTTRKPAKRGPTKVAALKALGLTKEELDAFKKLRDSQERVNATANIVEEIPSLEEVVAVLNEIKADEAQTVPDEVVSSEPQAFYARNLRNVDLGFRLARQSDKKERRTDLKGRGNRGDLVRLQPEDLNDSELVAQIEYGLVEIITQAEARDVISKQATNQQEKVHPALALLRNELDQPYAPGAVKVLPEANSQGITVAVIDGVPEGATKDQVNRGGIRRSGEAPQGSPLATVAGGPQAAAIAQDAIARAKSLQGPEAGGITTVTVEPVAKT